MTDTTLRKTPVAAETETSILEAMQPPPSDIDTRPSTQLNPLSVGLRESRVPDPCCLVLFGATGDLTARKLMPALYDLSVSSALPEGFAIIGVSHREWSDDDFRKEMHEAVKKGAAHDVSDESWASFSQGLFYVRGDFKEEATYTALKDRLTEVDRARRIDGNRLFYLATSPDFYEAIIHHLGKSGAASRQDIYADPREVWHRVVIEKPFGHDVASARKLIADMAGVFSERQIYRIDHYLGKETVQNVLAFRFANALFEPVFNRSYVDHVQITAAESIGVEGRGGYYDHAGALRDMVQSHLLQILCVVAMEPPAFFNGNAVRDEKIKVLRSIVPPRNELVSSRTVRGQYGPGAIAGRPVPGYLEERGVAPDSPTETFAALKFEIDNWRWADVPFYLRTGKRLPRRVTEVAIEFKKVPHLMFQTLPGASNFDLAPNVITMRIQPDEGIALRFAAKVPGPTTQLRTVRMDFYYGAAFGDSGPDAYYRLLLDAMLGDPTLFARRDEVESAWQLMQPILDGWAEGRRPAIPYEAGTWGPAESDTLLAQDGRQWRRP